MAEPQNFAAGTSVTGASHGVEVERESFSPFIVQSSGSALKTESHKS